MKAYILTITLNPAIDKTVSVPHFCLGRDFRETGLSISAGGKGINVSRVLKHLGVATLASGFLGGPSGDYIRAQLRREKISQSFCPARSDTRTSLTIIDPGSKAITRILEQGPLISKKELAGFKKNYSRLLKYSLLVVLSGRSIPGAPDALYAELIDTARRHNIPALLDTSGRPYELGLKARPWMITPNVKEAEQILGTKLTSLKNIQAAALSFRKAGISHIAITMGSEGALVYDGKEMLVARSVAVKVKSPVGCGDAFNAGFIAAYVRKQGLDKCVRLAVACGAANALSVNPGFITASTRKKIYRSVSIQGY